MISYVCEIIYDSTCIRYHIWFIDIFHMKCVGNFIVRNSLRYHSTLLLHTFHIWYHVYMLSCLYDIIYIWKIWINHIWFHRLPRIQMSDHHDQSGCQCHGAARRRAGQRPTLGAAGASRSCPPAVLPVYGLASPPGRAIMMTRRDRGGSQLGSLSRLEAATTAILPAITCTCHYVQLHAITSLYMQLHDTHNDM